MRSLLVLCALLVASPAAAQTIVLDPGHGGSDPGAVGCEGLQEAPTVLDVAQRTQVLLEGAGLNVDLTRTDDRFVGLSARASFANGLGADLFVAIHSNANGGTPATGSETWIANSASSTSVALGGHLQDEMVDAWGLPDRGVKRANFTVIATTRMPAALTELAFTNRCDPDAALLRSPAARAEMAEAHARAVLLTLGRDPGSIGGGPPPTGTGVLRGVAFEDLGAGLEDTSQRLDAAAVSIDGAPALVDAETAHFRVDLAPGRYTVRASLAGFADASRSCDVVAGGETWCSIGLSPATVEPPPVGNDAGPGGDAGEVDGGLVSLPVTSDAMPTGPGTERPGELEGCSVAAVGAPRASLAWLLGLGLALALLRRRRARPGDAPTAKGAGRLAPLPWLALSLVFGCGGDVSSAPAAVSEATASELETAGHAPRAQVTRARVVERLATVSELRPVAEGLSRPVLSPDGQRVAMSNDEQDQLWLYEDGAVELVAEGPRVGVRPVFNHAALRYRHAQQSSTAVPHHAIELGSSAGPAAPAPSAFVRLDDEHAVWLTRRGGASARISPIGDRYLEPSVSPDESHVVFWGMSTGLFLYRIADGALLALGDGGHPRFDDSGRWLVFDRTEDDGHALTGGELWIADTHRAVIAPLTDTPRVIEQMPSMANGRLAFATPEGVLVGAITID